MAKQTINIGSAANDGTGDPIRTAFDKVNDNFNELYSAGYITANTLPSSINGSVYSANNVLLVDGDNGKIVGPVETTSLSADEIFNADSITGKLDGSDFAIISSGGINFRVDSENENNLFEFMNDGTFYTSKNIVNDRSYISTPRNDAAGIMVLTSANEVIIVANENSPREWAFNTNGSLTFPDSSVQTGASISITDLKTLVADSVDFADFKSRIATL